MQIEPDFIVQQIKAVFDDIDIHAVKIGMLGDHHVIKAVSGAVAGGRHGKIILDPVMVAKSGDLLLKKESIEALAGFFIDKADLITPNLPEAATLLGDQDFPKDRAATLEVAKRLHDAGWKAILLKGGHQQGARKDDLFYDGIRIEWLEDEAVDTLNSHGTGCSLSSAIAAECAKGADMLQACMQAKKWLGLALRGADALNIGQGRGPIHHFHAFW